jgi:hypothetical protein
MTGFRASVSAIGSLFVSVSTCLGQDVLRLGHEFQVNAYTPAEQQRSKVALDQDGDFVIAWESYFQDGSGVGIFARRFDEVGQPQGAEFQVNFTTYASQRQPALSIDADGDFVVAWVMPGVSDQGVFARRFNAAGLPQGGEFHVNSYTLDDQVTPSLDLDADGDFVVAWVSYGGQDGSGQGVFARRFSSAGAPQAAEFQVNSYTMGDQGAFPSVSLDADGDFVVAWSSNGQDDSGYGVFARRFNAAGVPQAAEFEVNQFTLGPDLLPSVALENDGDFVVAWLGVDGGSGGIFARRFDAAGAPRGAQFLVNTYTSANQRTPAVSVDAGGDFVVVWAGTPEDASGYGIFARAFDSSGVARSGDFQVAAYTTGGQIRPSLSLDAGGKFVVTWSSQGQDGSDYGVFAQRFVNPAVLDIDGNGEVAPLTDGLLVLRFLFGFTGATLVAGAIDTVACTRCNSPAIEAYLATLI